MQILVVALIPSRLRLPGMNSVHSENNNGYFYSQSQDKVLSTSQMDSPQFKASIECLNMLRRKSKSCPSSTNINKLITSQLAVQKSMAEAEQIFENNLINGLANNNSSMTYKYIHRLRIFFASSSSVLRQY